MSAYTVHKYRGTASSDATDTVVLAGTGAVMASGGRKHTRIVAECSAGQTADITLLLGLRADGSVVDEAQSLTGVASASFSLDDGPWPYMAVEWASLSGGTITVDCDTWE